MTKRKQLLYDIEIRLLSLNNKEWKKIVGSGYDKKDIGFIKELIDGYTDKELFNLLKFITTQRKISKLL